MIKSDLTDALLRIHLFNNPDMEPEVDWCHANNVDAATCLPVKLRVMAEEYWKASIVILSEQEVNSMAALLYTIYKTQ